MPAAARVFAELPSTNRGVLLEGEDDASQKMDRS